MPNRAVYLPDKKMEKLVDEVEKERVTVGGRPSGYGNGNFATYEDRKSFRA